MKKKIIFVDLDGALITAKSARFERFDMNSVNQLNDLAEKGFSIIVLNNKRYPHNLSMMRDIFKMNGFSHPQKIIDIFNYDTKAESIQRFIRTKKPKKFFVIDDEELGVENQLKTDIFSGITSEIKNHILEASR